MEELHQVLQSLSPYVVITLTGDPVKSVYASMWGVRSPMPTVWINQFTAPDNKKIIANIWDLPLNKKSLMTPDHNIIFIDYNYRRMTLSKPSDILNLSDLITNTKISMSVILIGDTKKGQVTEDKKLCLTMGIPCLHIQSASNPVPDPALENYIRDKCMDIYRLRCHCIDKKIKDILVSKHNDKR